MPSVVKVVLKQEHEKYARVDRYITGCLHPVNHEGFIRATQKLCACVYTGTSHNSIDLSSGGIQFSPDNSGPNDVYLSVSE